MEIDRGALTREARDARRQLRAPHAILAVLLIVAAAAGVVIHPAVGLVVAVAAIVQYALVHPPRDVDQAVPGLPVTRDEQPDLWAEIDNICGLVELASPDEIVIGDDVSVRIVDRTSGMGRRVRHRTFVVGLPVLSLLTYDEFRATAVSLMSRDLDGPIPHGPRLARAAAAADAALAARTGPFSALRGRHLQSVLRRCEPFREAQVLLGDTKAADTIGRTQLGGALRRAHVGQMAFDRFAREYLVPLAATGARPANVYEGLSAFGADSLRDQWFEQLHVDATSTQTCWNPGEPPLSVRLLRLSGARGDERVPDARFATKLLADRERLEQEGTAQLMARLVPDHELSVVGWTEAGDVLAQLARARAGRLSLAAAALDPSAPRAGGLEHVLRLAVTNQRDWLASSIAPEIGDDEDRSDLVNDLLAVYLRSSLGSALVAHAGCSWRVSWSGSPTLHGPDGASIDIDEWVSGILAQQVAPRVVTDWLTVVGVPVGLPA